MFSHRPVKSIVASRVTVCRTVGHPVISSEPLDA